ncbi:MAG: hypothetical protein H0U44_00200 [Flavisolibacter sp.]|jgi:hypothetical protein|nr:hypothetical protein [Flavisolibacter sp.]
MRFTTLLFAGIISLASCKKNTTPNIEEPIANNQSISWIKSFGGTNFDFYNAAIQTSAGDYVVAGSSRSTDGDLTGARVSYDVWITRINVNGGKVWSKAYGDNSDEYVTSIVQTSDGGYFIVYYSGFPLLPVGGTPNYAWGLKTDADGNLLWKKQLSTSNDAQPFSVILTGDGNMLVSGFAFYEGSRKGWVSKINNNGDKVWEKHFGGDAEDIFNGAVRSADGGFVLTGYTKSANGDMENNKGHYDGWILKTDANGNKLWSKSFGGSSEDNLSKIVATSDGGYMAIGSSKSNNGDIGSNKGGFDAWIIKVDGNGNKQWVKTYGGGNEEYMTGLVPAPGGGFAVGGYTNSHTGDVSRTSGDYGGWLFKIDNNGNKTSASTYGGPGDEVLYSLSSTQDGYIIAGTTYSSSNGYDGWLVKVGQF